MRNHGRLENPVIGLCPWRADLHTARRADLHTFRPRPANDLHPHRLVLKLLAEEGLAGSSARTAPGEASAAASDSNEASAAGTGSNARTAPGEASSAASDSNEASAAGSTRSGAGAAPGTGAAAADGTEKLGGCRCGGGYGGGIGTRAGRAAVADGFNEDGGVGQQQLDAPCGTDSGGGDSRDRRDVGGRCGANDGECSDGFGF